MNKKNFDQMIKTFSEMYEKNLNPYVIKKYYDLLQEIPDNQVEAITNSCLRECEFFPRPYHIFKQLSETPEKYIYKPEPLLTKEKIEKNKAEAKAIADKLKGKFDII